MKALLLSVKPKWCVKILNGEKTIEVRKRFPKDYKGWVYIYATKQGFLNYVKTLLRWVFSKNKCNGGFNGKVVARFYCDKVEHRLAGLREWVWEDEEILNKSCLTFDELVNYSPHLSFYAIHISQLEIFDKPKELSEFKSYKKNIVNTKINGMVFETELDNSLTKAPQNYCYIEVDE